MRDEDTTTTTGGGTGQAEADGPPATDLSRAARDAVHQADPRIDRQLARMGLADPDEADPGGASGSRSGSRLVRAEDVERVDEAVAAVQETLARATRRIELLNWVVTFEGVAIAILAVLLLVR